MNRASWLALVVLSLVVRPAVATQNSPHPSRAERMTAIETEFQAAKSKQAAGEPQLSRWADRAWSLVNQDASDEVAFRALVWLVRNQPDPESTRKALAMVEKLHLGDPGVADLCRDLVRESRPVARDFLSRALVKSSSREVKGIACYGLARRTLLDCDDAERLKSGGAGAEALRASLGDEVARNLETLDIAEARVDAEKLLESVAEQFGDVKYDGRTLADAAHGDLFEMKSLAIGCAAPEIEGQDLDGAAFKLSDSRGKVVVLEFSEAPIPADAPERSLVKRLAGQPVALLVIAPGPIALRWNVRAWPTIHVLDGQGTIRFKSVRGEALDRAVEMLLAEQKGARSK